MKSIKLSVVKPGNQKPKRPSTIATSRKPVSSGVEAGRQPQELVLAASETRYRRLFESAQDGILILDAGSGIFIDVNPFLVRMLGFSKVEICGKELWELGFFKDIAANKSNFKELQRKKTSAMMTCRCRLPVGGGNISVGPELARYAESC